MIFCILEVGGDVYKRNTECQQELFDEYLSKHEERLLDRLEKQKKNALDELHKQHLADIERIKAESNELQVRLFEYFVYCINRSCTF